MSPAVGGDDPLTARLGELLSDKHRVAAVAVIDPGGARTAWRGCEPDADFEIGSVSKAVTGLLYADAVTRGAVTPDTTLGDLLPIAGAPAASVTLGALSVHRAGLPRLPSGLHPTRSTIELWFRGRNPYRQTLDEMLAELGSVTPGRTRPHYSNLGFALLGHAVAAAADATYAELVRERVAEPLGLEAFYATYSVADLRASSLIGTSRRGRHAEPWANEGIAPAGTIRSTIADLGTLSAALADGSAPGIAALDPVSRYAGRAVRIGAAWMVMDHQGREITWHNGGTGGFHSWLGVDRAAGTGVALVTATTRSVDRAGFALLAEVTQGDLAR